MKKLMIGNQAVAAGLHDGGLGVVSSYPGTPSTEITEFLAKYGHEFPDMVAEDKGIFVKFEGIYDDVYVAVIASTSWDNTKSPSETVGGITFTWDQWYDIHVYYHGDFLTLTEAFNRGLLTTAQLEEVYESYVTSFTAMFGDPNVFNG